MTFRNARAAPASGMLFEALEPRILLSGSVTASLTGNGVLQIRGDDAPNQIVIDGSSGNVQIAAQDGELLNGSPGPLSFQGVNVIKVNIRGSGNNVNLQGLDFPGDVILRRPKKTSFTADLKDVHVGGKLRIDGGADLEDVHVGAKLKIKGGADLEDVHVGKMLKIIGGSAVLKDVHVAGNLEVRSGDLTLKRVDTEGSMRIRIRSWALHSKIIIKKIILAEVEVGGDLQIKSVRTCLESGKIKTPFGTIRFRWCSPRPNIDLTLNDVVVDRDLSIKTGKSGARDRDSFNVSSLVVGGKAQLNGRQVPATWLA